MLFLFPLPDSLVIWAPFRVWNYLLVTSLPQDNWHPFRDQKDHQLFGSFSFHMEFCFAFSLSVYFISESVDLNHCPSWPDCAIKALASIAAWMSLAEIGSHIDYH